MASEWQTAFKLLPLTNAMMCLTHCRQELQQTEKLQDFFFKTETETRPNVQDQDQDFKIPSRPRPRPSLVFKTKTFL